MAKTKRMMLEDRALDALAKYYLEVAKKDGHDIATIAASGVIGIMFSDTFGGKPAYGEYRFIVEELKNALEYHFGYI